MVKNDTITFHIEQNNFRIFLTEFWNKEKFCDLNLKTSDGAIYPVHKIILSTFSGYFRKIIDDNLTLNEIDLDKRINNNPLQLILELLYTGKLNIGKMPPDHIIKLYELAQFFDMTELTKDVELSLINNTTIDNCLELWRAQEYFSDNLSDKFESFIKENSNLFFEKYVTKLTASEIITLLRFNNLNSSQADLYSFAVEWIKSNFEDNYKYVKYVFENISFLELPIKIFMQKHTIDEHVLQHNALLTKMVLKAVFADDLKTCKHTLKSRNNQNVPLQSRDFKIKYKSVSETTISDSSQEQLATKKELLASKSNFIAVDSQMNILLDGKSDTELELETKSESELQLEEKSELKLQLQTELQSRTKKRVKKPEPILKRMKQAQKNKCDTEINFLYDVDRSKSRLLITENSFNEINIKENNIFNLLDYKIDKWFTPIYLDDTNITVFIGGINSNKCQYFQAGDFHELPPLTQNRWRHSSLLYDSKIYTCGGQNNKTMEIFDLNRLEWMDGSSLLHQRWGFGFVEQDGVMFAVGGYSTKGHWGSKSYVEMYDPRVNEWQPIHVSNKVKADSIKAVNFNHKLIAFKWDRFNQFRFIKGNLEIGSSYYYPPGYECLCFAPFEFENDLYIFGENEDSGAKLFKFNSTSKQFENFVLFSKSFGQDLHIC